MICFCRGYSWNPKLSKRAFYALLFWAVVFSLGLNVGKLLVEIELFIERPSGLSKIDQSFSLPDIVCLSSLLFSSTYFRNKQWAQTSPLFLYIEVNILRTLILLTRFKVVEKKLINPLLCDTHLPPFLLQVDASRLSHASCLLYPVLNLLTVKSTQNFPEKVTLWIPLVLLRSWRIWQVLSHVWKLKGLMVQIFYS